jgi:glycosyltransferase involved in cell wall biosynthesis
MKNIEKMKIALIIPCYNEEAAIQSVVRDFKSELPKADCYVFDNGSTDCTVSKAKEMGVKVRHVEQKGKGNVVRRMFADVEADLYVMVDGDGTYDAASVREMIGRCLSGDLDMVVGARKSVSEKSYRFGHEVGNWMLTRFVQILFGKSFDDMLSGYRVFSKRFVKSFSSESKGFEIETELTVHALECRMATAEVLTFYGARVGESTSKLNTYKDGVKILYEIFKLYKIERPASFFSLLSLILIILSLIISYPVFITYLNTGLVPRLPTIVLSSSLVVLAVVLFASGLILDTVTRGRAELKRFHYLSFPSTINLMESSLNIVSNEVVQGEV